MAPLSHCSDAKNLTGAPTARLVLNLIRAFEKELLRRLEGIGVHDLTFADINLLRQIPDSGIRSSQLAQVSRVSKQAVAKTVASLEERGYVEVKNHPTDARARLVGFSSRGRKLYQQSLGMISAIDESYSKSLGDERYEALRSDLSHLLDLHAGWSLEDSP